MFLYSKTTDVKTVAEFGIESLLELTRWLSERPENSIYHGYITPEDYEYLKLHTGCSGATRWILYWIRGLLGSPRLQSTWSCGRASTGLNARGSGAWPSRLEWVLPMASCLPENPLAPLQSTQIGKATVPVFRSSLNCTISWHPNRF